MIRYLSRQLLYKWKQGLVLVLTFILCVLGFITVIRPLKILKDQIEENKALVKQGYYSYIVSGFNSLELDSVENDISDNKSDFMVVCMKEFDVEYLNLYGEGKVIVITDYWLKELENAYGKEKFRGFKLSSGSIPNNDHEVLVVYTPYTYYEFRTVTDERIGKLAVLPTVGECFTTGTVDVDRSVSFPTELGIGLIVTKEDFNLVSNGERITIFVLPDRTLDASEETKLKTVISKYAVVEESYFTETTLDTSGDEAELTLAAELSLLVIIAILVGETIVLSDFMKGNVGFINICSRLGLSKFGCFLMSQLPIVIYLVISEAIVFIILKLAEKADAISFLNIGHPYDLLAMLLQFIIILISVNYIYFRPKGKECR